MLPLLPLVGGGGVQGHRFAPVAMSLGISLSFAAIVVSLGAFGPAFSIDTSTVRMAGAAMVIAFALVTLVPAFRAGFSRWMLFIPSAAHAASGRLDGRSLGSALLLGGVLGLVWCPCSGPLLGSA